MASPLDNLIKATVKCTLCGAAFGQCDCWKKCHKCGWLYEKGKKCRNCYGDKKPRIIATGDIL